MPQMWANEQPVLPSQFRDWCKKKDALEKIQSALLNKISLYLCVREEYVR